MKKSKKHVVRVPLEGVDSAKFTKKLAKKDKKLKIKKLHKVNILNTSAVDRIKHSSEDVVNSRPTGGGKDKREVSEQSDYSDFSIGEKLTIERPVV